MQYIKILQQTNAHKAHGSDKIKTSTLPKYMEIIKPHFIRTSSRSSK